METFSALLALCAGNSPVTGQFPTQRPVPRSFDVFFDLRLNQRLSIQWSSWYQRCTRIENTSSEKCSMFARCLVSLCLGRFYPWASCLPHWHWGNHTNAPVPVKQPLRIWANASHESISTDSIKQNKTQKHALISWDIRHGAIVVGLFMTHDRGSITTYADKIRGVSLEQFLVCRWRQACPPNVWLLLSITQHFDTGGQVSTTWLSNYILR